MCYIYMLCFILCFELGFFAKAIRLQASPSARPLQMVHAAEEALGTERWRDGALQMLIQHHCFASLTITAIHCLILKKAVLCLPRNP